MKIFRENAFTSKLVKGVFALSFILTLAACPMLENPDIDGDGVLNTVDVDDDNDGLIEITGATMAEQLTMLHNMRYNLDGTSYKSSASDTGNTNGAPRSATINCPTDSDNDGTFLCGYELVSDLNFDKNGNGYTWSTTAENPNPNIDPGDITEPYFPAAPGRIGWNPVGTGDSQRPDNNDAAFKAIFEGNGHTITGLAMVRSHSFLGLFGKIAGNAQIRNLGLVNNLSRNTAGISGFYTGGLVGWQGGGIVVSSYATGRVVGASIGTGGLVARLDSGSIVASFTTGTVSGTTETGGLLGRQWDKTTVSTSYSTARVTGSTYVGGLIGDQGVTGITGSGTLIASYASGGVSGGRFTGSLIGIQRGNIYAGFGFGASPSNRFSTEITHEDWLNLPAEDRTAASLTFEIANTPNNIPFNRGRWDSAATPSSNAWNFGNNTQSPALEYSDYDNRGSKFHCDNAANPPQGAVIIACSKGPLIPNQGR